MKPNQHQAQSQVNSDLILTQVSSYHTIATKNFFGSGEVNAPPHTQAIFLFPSHHFSLHSFPILFIFVGVWLTVFQILKPVFFLALAISLHSDSCKDCMQCIKI